MTLLAFIVSVVLLLAVETQWKKLTINALDQPERQCQKTANATLNRGKLKVVAEKSNFLRLDALVFILIFIVQITEIQHTRPKS